MDRILFVDDDANLLASHQRQLKHRFTLDTASDGIGGLEKIASNEPYAVIISDYRMPGMNGVEFLSRAKESAPDSVRVLLTGYADLETAVGAVNDGNIFRLLTKPCPSDLLVNALEAGIRQYRLITAERELLEKTLRGSLKMLSEVLSLLNPEAFGRASRITRYTCEIASQMGATEKWQLETAAMLSQIGCIILPEDMLKKICQGAKLTTEETQIFNMHPSIAHDLISKIPRMEGIAGIIIYQEKHFDGSGIPINSCREEEIPLGARILKVCLDFDAFIGAGLSRGRALEQLYQRSGWYDPRVLKALEAVLGGEAKYEIRSLRLREIKEKMILTEDIRNTKGMLLLAKGQEITRPLLTRLINFVGVIGVREPIHVIVPIQRSTDH